MIHIIIWVVMFLVWYLYRTYKASVEENEEVYQASESTTVNDNIPEEIDKLLDLVNFKEIKEECLKEVESLR